MKSLDELVGGAQVVLQLEGIVEVARKTLASMMDGTL
jgi:hypothetical protein